MTKYKYELVEDLTVDEIAKAMIDGEVFYSNLGDNEYYWKNGGFRLFGSKECDLTTLRDILSNLFYRRVECDWIEKLDGTVENSVLCWVSDYNKEPNTALKVIKDISLHYIDLDNSEWWYAIPLTKKEIRTFIDNAPE